jgi:hypothetical protein
MINIKESDKDKFGAEIYHHKRKQGNFRWDTSVFRGSSGEYTVVFRYSFSKKNDDGVKRTVVRDEVVVRAHNVDELLKAEYPDYRDVKVLKSSPFFLNLTKRG